MTENENKRKINKEEYKTGTTSTLKLRWKIFAIGTITLNLRVLEVCYL